MSQPSSKRSKSSRKFKQYKSLSSTIDIEQCQKIIKTIEEIKCMKQLPFGLIEFIAEYATGYVIKCNIGLCCGEIFFLKGQKNNNQTKTNLFDISIHKCNECKSKFNAFVCSDLRCNSIWLCLEELNYIKQDEKINNRTTYLFNPPQGVCTGTSISDCIVSYCSQHLDNGINCVYCNDYYCKKCQLMFGQKCYVCHMWCCCDCIKILNVNNDKFYKCNKC